jgi:hypothetical protein
LGGHKQKHCSSFNFAKRWHFVFRFLSVYGRSVGRIRVAHKGFAHRRWQDLKAPKLNVITKVQKRAEVQ